MESFSTSLIENYPNTVLLFEKLLPAFLVLIGLAITLWIQLRHAAVQRNRLGFDLFEKRFAFLQIIRNITAISLSNDGRYFERLQKDYPRFVEYRLLFPKWISKEVERLLVQCDQLLVANQGIGVTANAKPDSMDEAQAKELRAKIRQQMTVLQRTIEDFIRIDWKG